MYRDSDDESSDVPDTVDCCEYCHTAPAKKYRKSNRYCEFCYKRLEKYIFRGELCLTDRYCEENRQCIDTGTPAKNWCEDCMVITCTDHARVHVKKVECCSCQFKLCAVFTTEGVCKRCAVKKT